MWHRNVVQWKLFRVMKCLIQKSPRIHAIIAAAAFWAGAAFGHNLITNGSFELPGNAATVLSPSTIP